MKKEKVAIIGYASRLPQTSDARFWTDLLAGRDLVTRVAEDRWALDSTEHPQRAHPGTSVTFAAGSLGDVAGFDAGFFHISPREAAVMDPQQRLLLEMSWEALAHAGLQPARLRGSRCGVFIGLASTDYGYRMADDLAAIGANSATGSAGSIAANRLSYFYDLQGPSVVVDTACSSALVAFHQACQSLLREESDLALTGAISVHLHPFGFLIFSKASMLSAEGRCRPFDAHADGYVRAEGGGVFVLKTYAKAVQDGDRILAVVAHTAVNTDGHKAGLTIPRVTTQAALLSEAYAVAGIEPECIDYIEAHGTGTAVGDPVEVEAIGRALGMYRPAESPLPIGSVKSNLGHLETASGIPGLLKAIHSLQQRKVPATIGVRTLNPRLPLADYHLEVVTTNRALRPVGPLVIGVNSFGFGGANAHVILERAPETKQKRGKARKGGPDTNLPVLLSAATPTALRRVVADFADHLSGQPGADCYHSLYQVNFRRAWLRERVLFRSKDKAAWLMELRAFARGENGIGTVGTALETPRGPVFVYSGNGSQWTGMGRALLDDPVFTQILMDIDAVFRPLAGYDLRDDLAGVLGEGRYARTEYAQPALFALQVGLTEMLRGQGIRPVAVLGHSVGEVAAAWACGSLSLTDAVRVIYERSRLQAYSRGGGQMTAVAMGADTVQGWLKDWELTDVLQIAAWNSPRGATVVGKQNALTRLEQNLRRQGVGYKRLDIDYPFHSAQMDALRDDLLASLTTLRPQAGTIPFYSAVTGETVAGAHLDALYWWRNIREPVRFQQAVEALLPSWNIFVELGGHSVLRNYLQEMLKAAGQEGRVVPSLHRGEYDALAVQRTAEAIWVAGIPAEWSSVFEKPGHFVDLPHYPWEREHYWHPVTSESAGALYRYVVHPLLGYPVAQHCGEWEQTLDIARMAYLADHRVGETVLFPGAGYIELLLAAARERLGSDRALLEDLEILAPLVLDAEHGKVLRVTVNEEGAATVQSRTLLETVWTLHAKGQVSRQTDAFSWPADAMALPSHAPDFERSAHYRRAELAGLHYGPVFQTVETGWLGPDTALARLALPTDAPREGFLLHPALLDGAFQLFVDLLADQKETEPGWGYIPVRVERLALRIAGADIAWARVRMLRRSPQSILAEVILMNGQGEVVVRCEGLRLRKLRLSRGDHEAVRYLATQLAPLPRRDTIQRLPGIDPVDLQVLADQILADSPELTRYVEEFSPLAESLLQACREVASGVVTDGISMADIWQTLLQDYPEFFPVTLRLGRWGLHCAGQGEAEQRSDPAVRAHRCLLNMFTPALAAGLTERLRSLRPLLPNAARLGVLEISSEAPEWMPVLATVVEDSHHFALFHAVMAGTEMEAGAGEGWETVPVDSEEVAGNHPLVHMAWVRLDQQDGAAMTHALRYAAHCLVETGVLMVQGWQPEMWWHALDDAMSPLPNVSTWCQWLQDHGFVDVRMCGTEKGNAGPFLLIARKGAPVQSLEPARIPAKTWLLAAAVEAAERPEVIRLQTSLAAQGVTLRFCPVTTADTMHEVLAHASAGQAVAGLICLDTLGMTTTAAFPGSRLLHACQILRASGLWGLKQDAIPAFVLLTAGGVMATHPAQGASRPSPEVLDAAGLCGFARSLQNEWPALSLRILDWGPVPTVASAEAVVREVVYPDAETELVFDAEGARYGPRVREVALSPGTAEARQAAGYQLRFSTPGQLRHLQWVPCVRPDMAAHEVEIAVEAVGLNFRDVMYALGILSDEALEGGFSGPGLGLEFAGRISAVGAAVQEWALGDAVLGFAPSSFSTHVRTSARTIALIPEGMGMTAAATVPTVFFTAWYALRELARLEEGERVLIHGGAGGVGIAAIQIAQLLGAEVFATAGSPEKRDFLRLLGVEHVYDSRSLGYAESIMRDTGGEGVDILLNSLSGEAIRRNLQVLRPFGRFLELGKRDFYENSALGLRPFRQNLSYYGIDADQLLRGRPALTARVFAEVMTHFRGRDFYPLPLERFPARRVVDAFRHMQQARQIGKVVVEMGAPFAPIASLDRPASAEWALRPDGVYLVTGGLSGFGLETARRLVQRGARLVALASRTGQPDATAQESIQMMREQGAEVRCVSCDVSKLDQVASLFAYMQEEMGILRGIVHAAAVIDDALAQNLTDTQMRAVIQPKVAGAWHLHQFSQSLPLDFFVLYSSMTTMLGNPGQAHYVAANTWMEALVEWRRAAGLPATAILWGAIGDVGYLSHHTRTRDVLQSRLGGAFLTSTMALDILETILYGDRSGMVVAEWDWPTVCRSLPGASAPKFSALRRHSQSDVGADPDLCVQLRALPQAEALAMLTEMVRREVGQILRLSMEKIAPEQNLAYLGLDSLMAMELALALEERMGIKLPAFLLSESPTPMRLAQRLQQELGRNGDPANAERAQEMRYQRLLDAHGITERSALR